MFESQWQDTVLMIGNLFFFIALIPSIMSVNKPSKWTSLTTAIILSIFCIIYFTLSLTHATIGSAVTAVAWWILYFQKVKSNDIPT